jgi:hypothetical protein
MPACPNCRILSPFIPRRTHFSRDKDRINEADREQLRQLYTMSVDDRRHATYPVFVSVMKVERLRGGPEEGGWYYLHREPEEISLLPVTGDRDDDRRRLTEKLYRLSDRYSNRGLPELSSVLFQERHDIIISNFPQSISPRHTPRYE